MSRYISKGGSVRSAPEGDYDDPLLPSLYVDEPSLTDTGLIDTDGYTIYRIPPPIGFGRDEEW